MGELVRNLEFLKAQGFRIAPFGFAESVSIAVQTANKIGFPIVLKIPSQMHKMDVGGVLTHIHDVADLKNQSKEMVSNLAKKGIPFDGVIVQQQISGIEVILGLKEDPVFGKTILFGSGGTYAELTKDVSFRICPITEKDAEEMINETKAKELFAGFRRKPVKTDELKKTMVAVSRLELKELDLNPVIVNESGCWIVDARIVQ